MIITTLSIRTDGTVQSLITPGPTIRSLHVQNLTPVMVLVRDNGGSLYRVTAGQTTLVKIQPSSSVDIYTEQATTTGRATVFAYDDVAIDQSLSSGSGAGSLSGRGAFYDRMTAVQGEVGGQVWSTGSINGNSYTVPLGRVACLVAGWLQWERTAAPGTRRAYTLWFDIDLPNSVLQPVGERLLVPTWQTRAGVIVHLALMTPIWLPPGTVCLVKGITSPSGSDFGVRADWSYEIVEFDA